MSKALQASLLLLAFFTAETTMFAEHKAVVEKKKEPDFKYKTKSGDISRDFVKDFFGNSQSYLSDLFGNFKKHPELFLTTVALLVPYWLYQKEVNKKVEAFLYGNAKQSGHRDKVVYTLWASLLAIYANKKQVLRYCNPEENKIKKDVEELVHDASEAL